MNRIRRIICLLVMQITVLGMTGLQVHAAALPTVTYHGSDNRFSVEAAPPYAGESQSDLFQNFKDIMPGDMLEQSMQVCAKEMAGKSVSIRLTALESNTDYQTLMGSNRVTLTVETPQGIYTGDLENGVELGEFSDNTQKDITVRLAFDEEATGEELESLTAKIDWRFEAELVEDTDGGSDPGDSDSGSSGTGGSNTGASNTVKTGDQASIFLYLGICICCGLVLGWCIYKKARRHE